VNDELDMMWKELIVAKLLVTIAFYWSGCAKPQRNPSIQQPYIPILETGGFK
jgi:hypothetical protein